MTPEASAETPVYDETNHLEGTCDSCGNLGKFSFCVTSKTEHLHSCWRPACKDKLEKRLSD